MIVYFLTVSPDALDLLKANILISDIKTCFIILVILKEQLLPIGARI